MQVQSLLCNPFFHGLYWEETGREKSKFWWLQNCSGGQSFKMCVTFGGGSNKLLHMYCKGGTKTLLFLNLKRLQYLDMEMWKLWTWFSDGFGSDGLTIRLDDLKGLFKPTWFCDSIPETVDIVWNLFLVYSYDKSCLFMGFDFPVVCANFMLVYLCWFLASCICFIPPSHMMWNTNIKNNFIAHIEEKRGKAVFSHCEARVSACIWE